MKQSTFSAVMANGIKHLLQGYTKGIRFVAVLTMLLTMGIGQAWGAEATATLSFASTAQRVSQNSSKQVWSNDGITFTNNKASSSTAVGNYSKPVRLYAGSNVIVEHTSKKITKIVFDCNSSSYATAMKNSIGTVSGATVTVSSDKVTVTFTTAVPSFTVAKLTEQVRLDSITVTYNAGWILKGSFDNWGDGVEMTEVSTGKATATLDLAANTYEFKFVNGSNWLGNSGTINADISNWVFKTTEESNVKLNSGLGGTFTFTIDYSASTTQPKVTVTYPRKTIYLKPGVWTADGAKYAIYYFINGQDGWSGLMTQGTCDKDVYSATIPQWNGLKMDLVRLNSDATAGDWNKKWNQTNDITIISNDYVTITGWDQANFTYTTYTPPTYTITFSGNGNTGGSMTNVSGIPCEGSTTLATNGYTRTGYTFTNWKTNVAVTANSSSVAANGSVDNKATISNVKSNITLTAQWKANTYTITYKDGGNTNFSGTHESGYPTTHTYGTATTLKNATKTGYTFDGWYKESACTNKVTSLGANAYTANITLYAKWTPITYSINWVVNGAPYENGGSTEAVHNSTYKDLTLPTAPEGSELEACYDDKVFVGWSTTDVGHIETNKNFTLLAEVPTTSITANKTFYAVFATETPGTAGDPEWVATELANITASDVVVITMTKNSTVYALSSANGSSNAPAAPTLTISNGKLSANPADALKWNISNSNGTLTIYPNGKTSTWLYCTNTNNGVRVGNNSNKSFTIDASSGYLKNTATSRFVGVYTTNPDWRCYTSTATNIDGQTLKFYKETSTASPASYSDYVSKCYCVTEIALAMTGEHKNLDVGETNQLLVTYKPEGATCDKEIVSWTSSDDNVMSVTSDGLVKALRAGNATITATTKGGVTATYTITVNNPACDSWYIHYWNNSTSGDECFYKVKPDDPNDHEWRTNNFSLPSFSDEDKFIVNNTPEDPYKTDQVFRTGIGFADIQRGGQNCGTNPYPGQDAYGQLSIYDDSKTSNRYIAFYPAQYLVTYGKDGTASWEVLPLNNTTGYEYETEPFMVPNGYKTDDTYKYYVGITDKNGNIKYVGYEFGGVEYKKSSVDPMNTVNGLSASDMAGKWGVWHIWSNSCANNWYAEFIRYYRVDFDLNGGEGDNIAPRYGKATTPYVTFNTTDITAPTRDGYTFLGWKDQKGKSYNPTESTVTINDDLTLTAQWAKHHTVTYDANEGTTRCEDDNIYIEGETVKVCADQPTRTGYTFDGWIRSDNGERVKEGESFTMPDEDVTLKAKWIINQYTVTLNPNYPAGKTGTFIDNNGNMVNQVQLTYDYNTASMSLTGLYQSIELEGYQFNGWYSATSGGSEWTSTGTITRNVTVYAQWTKLYSITLSENGTTTTPTTQTSTSYTLPETLSVGSCDNDEKELVGWSTVAIPTPGDKPTTNFYDLGETVTLTADQTTFYAVFATPGEGGVDNTDYSNVHTSNVTLTNEGGTNATNSKVKISEVDYTAVKAGTGSAKGAVKITVPAGTTKLSFHIAGWNKEGGKTISLTGATATPSSFITVADAGVSGSSTTYTLSGTIANYFYSTALSNINTETTLTFSNGGADQRFVIWGVNASTGGGTTYSDYTTTCVKLPDPVWEGATIDKTALTVNCGERSPMTGANGAAKITFPTEKIYNFTKKITIEATTGFLVSTNQTVDANYKSSVSLSPRAGNPNANTFDDNVYVRAEAPAQSSADLEGTITIKNSEGETLQTFSVTADVTCTQYTLTLVDRGVSTEQATKYYAGETIDEAPADPEGVCTDPIHYVFDGWAEATVAEGSTTYTKVTFPYTVKGNTKFYAVYRYLEGGGNGDYNLVTSALDDWSGDYLIAYSDQIFANGKIGGKDGIGAAGEKVDLSSYITNNTIPAAEGDKYKVSLEAINGGYLLKTQDGQYNYQSSNTNGLEATTNKNTATTYKLSVNFVSSEEINLCLSGNAQGAIFRYNTDQQGYFRFYKNGGQQPVYLYKKADGTTYYTTSPVCGPHLVITEGKEIYVTGGNAGGTRDLVIAQQKVSYKATRLQTSNGLVDGTAPDVKVATNGITVGGVVTSDVKVTIDQTKELQADGTYTIAGTITVQYQPSANNKQEDIQVQLAVDYNTDAKDNFTVHARSLPSEFVIVAKSGDKWYALNGDMNNGSSANPANGQVTLDDDANPTKATYAPCNTIYTFDGVPNTGDRTRVRFQGTDGAWLWAASGTNVGIQNKSLKDTPEGDNKAYNWKLETEDNITYKFHNDNSSRLLGLSGEKFGMYASAVQELRILPYVEKCLYNYAPSNLIVKELKGSYVVLTWDAVIGATKYQYRTNGTTWTDAGTEPTVTINNLTGATEYTYYIRAYHEDAGVSQECIDYAEITFTTADCDDVPTNITYTADLNSITVSWTAAAPTATIKLFMNEDGTGGGGTYPGATSPYTISGGLDKNTTYYIQILSDGTCASPIIPVKTEDVEVDIVEWEPQGIIVDINTNETVGVTLENEVSYGTGLGTEATELFFSKYYEASYNVKLVAIYNGTKNIIDLTDYTIQYGKTSWENNYITLKDFGATKGQIQPGEEIILYSMQDGTQDDDIMDCVHDAFPDGNWVRVTSSNNTGKGTLSFGGDKTIILCKTEYDDEADEYYDNIIDVIGALKDDPNEGILPTNENTEKPSWGDNKGWVCETGVSIADDSQLGISTNRCLLIRNNTVTSGENAVAQNVGDFVTLCSEWKGAQVPDSDVDNGVAASCENFAYVGTFDYSDYYTKYVPMDGGTSTFDENDRNPDGTVTISIPDLYKRACSNIRVKLTNEKGEVLTDREYKVPIMITTDQTTAGQAFLELQENLATVEVDDQGNVIKTYPLTLDEVREICKTCDVVIRDNATLTKAADDAANDHPQVNNVMIYEGASLEIPNGADYNYTINSLSLRRKGDIVASAKVEEGGKLHLPASATAPIYLDMRVDANNWHWFTLPYNCNIADVTWVDGTPAQYNKDWFIMYYDGNSRANEQSIYENHWRVYNGTTIEAGKGYIVGIQGDITHPNYTFELRFPMATEVLTNEYVDKTVAVNAWGVNMDITPNKKGWNLVGNPYLDYYKTSENISFKGLSLIKYGGIDPVTGDRLYDDSGNSPFLVTPVNGGWYEYRQELASDVEMMPFTAYFVQVGDPANASHTDGMELHAKFVPDNRGRMSLIRRTPQEVDGEQEPVIVRVEVANAKGESDKTTLIIDDRFTNEYEMNADFFKWFGDYYRRYTKPVLYSMGADAGKRAFNALSEQLAAQPIPLGMFAAQTGDYTFTLTRKRCDLSSVEEVWLYDATTATYTNLMQQDYTFTTAKTEGEGRFYLSVKMRQNTPTDITDIYGGNVWANSKDGQIIVSGLTDNTQLWIYDATGKLLHTEQTTNFQHVYEVPVVGTYFVRTQVAGQSQTIKVLVE